MNLPLKRQKGLQMGEINVTVNGVTKEFPEGVSIQNVYAEMVGNSGNPLVAIVNGSLRELFKKLYVDSEIVFQDIHTEAGRKTYERGLTFLMLAALYRLYGQDECNNLRVEHSLGQGIYCEINGRKSISSEFLGTLKKEMNALVKEDRMIEKKSMNTANAIRLFEKNGMEDKVKLFSYRLDSKTNVYMLAGYTDYFYGFMPASTACLGVFDLVAYEEGFLLMLPDRENPKVAAKPVERPKLYKTLQEANRWGKSMEVNTIGDLNEVIASGNTEELILVQEALMEQKIADIALQIRNCDTKKFIMIAGPSSSGKTSFSHRLSIQLKTLGLRPHTIALDNFYIDRALCPKNPDGSYNFECVEALDIELFNKTMLGLLNGETMPMPTFNFKTGKQEFRGNTMQMGKEDILVIEGINGLNDKLSYSLPKESKYKIYISALTELNIDRHNRIPTTDGRLIRRIVRDAMTRGTLARDTIAMWNSVRNGEENYIFPFQEEADYMFNSASIFELAVLKLYAEPLLFSIPRDCPEYPEAKRLLKFFSYFLNIPDDAIPRNSISREFVGGSCFEV